MGFNFDLRPSDSPLVESIWRTYSVGGGSFISTAASHWEMVVTKQKDKITFSIRGPETIASPAPIPEDAEFLGIVFKRGVFMPYLPKTDLVNTAVHLSESLKNSFSFFGGAWQFPTFENVDTFVKQWVRNDLLAQDQVVDDVLRGHSADLSIRSLQRRFLYVTGLTHKTIQQIERARQASSLLQSGASILDATYQAGYFDQAHLTRSLKLFYGQTPKEIASSG
jgi:AraC-like DNA-binding protein